MYKITIEALGEELENRNVINFSTKVNKDIVIRVIDFLMARKDLFIED